MSGPLSIPIRTNVQIYSDSFSIVSRIAFPPAQGCEKGSPNIKRLKTNKSTVCHLHEEPTYLRHTTERHRKQVALIQLGLLRQPSFHILLRSKRTYGQPLPLLLSFFRPRNEHETAGSGGGSAENVWFPAPLDVALYLSRRAPPKRVLFHPPT